MYINKSLFPESREQALSKDFVWKPIIKPIIKPQYTKVHTIEIFNEAIKDETRCYFLTNCLESKRLSDEEFEDVFDYLKEREDIIERIGLPYFYWLMRMYPEARDIIREYIYSHDSLESEEIYIPYELERKLIPKGYSVGTLSEVEKILENFGIDFASFIYCIPPESLKKDVNHNVFFKYAFNFYNINKKYIVALIETCCIYREEYDFLKGYYESDVLEKNAFISLLEELLNEYRLSSAAVNMVYDFFIALNISAEKIFERYPMLFLNILEHKEGRFLCEWTGDIGKKAALYNMIAKNNPQKILHVLKCHFNQDQGDALKIFSQMEPIGWGNILGRADLSDVLEFLLTMGRENYEIISQLLVFEDPQ